MSWLTKISLRNRSIVVLVMIAVVLLGLFGITSLKQELIPDLTFPFLTVVAQPAMEMGRRAVAVLLERQANPSGPAQDVVLPTELIVRRSSGGPVAEPAR